MKKQKGKLSSPSKETGLLGIFLAQKYPQGVSLGVMMRGRKSSFK
jgi:hypothetical protein